VYAVTRKLRWMVNAGAARSKSAPWRWAAAIVFSLCANSLVAGLFWELRVTPFYESAPPPIIQLIPRPTLPRRSSETPKRTPAHSAPLAVRPSSAPVTTSTATAPIVPSAPTALPPDRADVANLSRALRGLFGCNLAHLTDAERAACASRLAANLPTTPTPLNLDPHGRYVSNPEPYLTRMPKNGCKVRASGDTAGGPGGKHGVAMGIGCGVSF
jgi:hypothetical protein